MARENLSNGYAGKEDETMNVPVLIIGGGPTGLFQSYLLSRLGIKSLVVERHKERMEAPKAHNISPRSLEICRQFGLDTKAMRQLSTKREDACYVNFLTSLSGELIGKLPYKRMDPEVFDITPEMIQNIAQPIFEEFIEEKLSHTENADVMKGMSFLSLEQRNGAVSTTVQETDTGRQSVIKSRYVIACDGANSKVREYLEIESDGEDSYQTMMAIHFSADLRPIVGERVGMLHWIFDPLVSGVMVTYNLENNSVLITNFDSHKYPVECWNEDLCRQVLSKAIGKDIQPKVLGYRPWTLNRKVAKSFRVGNVFLAGDAAHSFPPTGALGMNSAVADVHNLACKMTAIYRGYATDAILDSYETERRPVAEVYARQSLENGKMMFSFLKALGTAGISDVTKARENLLATVQDPNKRAEIDRNLDMQRTHLISIAPYIGYVYGDSANPVNMSDFTPRHIAGARLPHAWIQPINLSCVHGLSPVDLSYVKELPASEVASKQYSTFDLCAIDCFTIILSDTEDTLYHTVLSVVNSCDVPAPTFNIYLVDEDFEVLPGPMGDAWLRESGLRDGGGLLIRPDQHILLPLEPETSVEQIKSAIDAYLGLK